MPSLTVIREGVAQILRDGLVDGVHVHAGIVDTVTPPAIEIIPVEGTCVAFGRGVVELLLELRVTTRGEAGQSDLDDLISAPTLSIPAVLFARPTAGQNATDDTAADGVTYTISDQGWFGYSAIVPTEGLRQWQVVYRVKVLAKGTT